MRVVLALLALSVTVGRATAGDDWPQFRGPRGDGHSDSTGVPLTWSESEHVRWKTPIHDRGWASPVVWGQQIWLTTASKDGRQMYAVCIDRDSGRIVYDRKLFDVEKPSPGHELNSYASPTPVVEEGRVYVHFGSYGTACLDTASGKTLWTRRDLPCEHYRGPGSSPILYGNLLIMHYDGYDYQYVVALDKHSGKTVWKKDRDVDHGNADGDFKKAFATPLVIEADGRTQLISTAAKAVLALDPMSGKELWRVRYNEHSATARPLFGHGLVYVNTGFGKAELWAIRPTGSGDVTSSHVAWKVTKSIGSKPSPVLVDDLIFQIHDSGVATCLDAKTGAEVWTKRLGGNYSASPIVVEGRIYFASQQGITTVIKAGRPCEILAANKLDAGCMASPAVTGKAILLRTETHLYRLE